MYPTCRTALTGALITMLLMACAEPPAQPTPYPTLRPIPTATPEATPIPTVELKLSSAERWATARAPTPTPKAAKPTPTYTPTYTPLGVTLAQVYAPLQRLGASPLNSHGPEWKSISFWGSNVGVDFYGPGHDLETVEVTFHPFSSPETLIRALEAILDVVTPVYKEDVLQWFDRALTDASTASTRTDLEASVVGLVLKFHYRPVSKLFLFSVERAG